jgi:hypothetical protein
VGFEPTIAVLERAKTVRALDRSPTAIGVDNIKKDILEIGWGGADWIGLAQERDKWRALVNAVMNLRGP